MLAERASASAARLYVEDNRPTADSVHLPPNILTSQHYRPLLEWMLQSSWTFRRQCLRVAQDPHVTVIVQTRRIPLPASARALTRMRRPGDGSLVAEINIVPAVGDEVELIAHELEHVIEQLDGIDLPARAAVANSGVRALADSELAFETTRATAIGLRVAREVSSARRAD